MDDVIRIILGVVFCVAAWRPPIRDPEKPPTLLNPDSKRWNSTPYRSATWTERIVRVIMVLFGLAVLVDGVAGLIG